MKINESNLKKELKEKVREYGFKCDSGEISSEKFFYTIDGFIKGTPIFFELMLSKIIKRYKTANILVTGEFGKIFRNYFRDFFRKNPNYKLILIPGSVRLGTARIKFRKFQRDFLQRKNVFLDDSFCSGSTFRIIEDAVRNQGGKIDRAYIIYFNPRKDNRSAKPKGAYTFFDLFRDFREYERELKRNRTNRASLHEIKLSEIKKGYNEAAENYDKLAIGDNYRAFSKLIKLGLKFYHNKTAKVLDLACGTGLSSIELFKKSFEVTGIDTSNEMLVQAKKYPYKRLICQNIEKPLKVPNNHFDIIILAGAMEFISSPLNLFAEVKKKMNGDGLFFITIPERYPEGSYLREKLHRHSYARNEIESIFGRAGLKILKFKKIFGYHKKIEGKREKSYFYCYVLKK